MRHMFNKVGLLLATSVVVPQLMAAQPAAKTIDERCYRPLEYATCSLETRLAIQAESLAVVEHEAVGPVATIAASVAASASEMPKPRRQSKAKPTPARESVGAPLAQPHDETAVKSRSAKNRPEKSQPRKTRSPASRFTSNGNFRKNNRTGAVEFNLTPGRAKLQIIELLYNHPMIDGREDIQWDASDNFLWPNTHTVTGASLDHVLNAILKAYGLTATFTGNGAVVIKSRVSTS